MNLTEIFEKMSRNIYTNFNSYISPNNLRNIMTPGGDDLNISILNLFVKVGFCDYGGWKENKEFFESINITKSEYSFISKESM